MTSLPRIYEQQVHRLRTGAVIPHAIKHFIAQTSLLALGVTFELTSQHTSEMREEIEHWEDDVRIGIGVLPTGPIMTVMKKGDHFHYLGMSLKEPDIIIYFKNLDSALMIFTGQLGAPQAVAENRICLHGNNYLGMQVTRAMAIVQTYLFPNFLLAGTFKRPPKLDRKQQATKALIMAKLVPRLVTCAFL